MFSKGRVLLPRCLQGPFYSCDTFREPLYSHNDFLRSLFSKGCFLVAMIFESCFNPTTISVGLFTPTTFSVGRFTPTMFTEATISMGSRNISLEPLFSCTFFHGLFYSPKNVQGLFSPTIISNALGWKDSLTISKKLDFSPVHRIHIVRPR